MKIDTLSPSFFAGLLAYAVSGIDMAFPAGALVAWFALTLLIVAARGKINGRNQKSAKLAMPSVG